MEFKLEICVDSAVSALIADQAGAHRIELCDNLTEGGTSPGPGKILFIRKNSSILMNVLIRPRCGDFLFTDDEFEIMKTDIGICRDFGTDGVVSGILRSDGSVDIERTSELVELARPMSFTFHRAFDMCSDPMQALEDIIMTGADRLLTSGQMNTAKEGVDLIAKLVSKAGERIIVMPGSGINERNIAFVARFTGAKEFHLSASKNMESDMVYRRYGISLGKIPDMDEYRWKIADSEKIKMIIDILKKI